MSIRALLRQVLPVAPRMSRAWIVAVVAGLLASGVAMPDSHAGDKRKKHYKSYYSPPPPPAPKYGKPQSRRADDRWDRDRDYKSNDDRDDDRWERQRESDVAERSRRDNDDAREREDEKGEENRREGRENGRAREQEIPSTVADLVKQLFAPPRDATPSASFGRGDAPRKPGSHEGQASKLEPRPAGAGGPKPNGRHTASPPLKVPDARGTDILVRNLAPATLRQALTRGMKVESKSDFGVLGYSVTRLVPPPDMNAAEAKALLLQENPQAAVDLNQMYRLYPSAREESGDSPQWSKEPARPTGGCTSDRCYGAATIGWQEQSAKCAQGLRVGVIDTGIDSTHPSLADHADRIKFGRFGPGYRGAGSDLHGTGVVALLAGSTRSTTPGLIPGARFYVADIFFADENGLPVSTTLHLLEALEWMDRLNVQIINLSLSGPRDDLVHAAIMRMSRPRTVEGVARAPVVFVAAAGNGGPSAPPSYPAAYPEALAVTAVNRELRGYRRANQGNYIDVAAPGVDIWTALPDGRQGYQTGTSFAVPYMTAVVASLYRALPRHNVKQAVLDRISVQDLGPVGHDRIYGRGLVQAPAACGPGSPWSPSIISRVRAPTSPVHKTASR